MSVWSWKASPLPDKKDNLIFFPTSFAAFSIPTFPPRTIKSAKETYFFLEINPFWIFSKTLIVLESWEGLFTFQSFCGASLILAPLAPPLLSEPLKVDADAHAVETKSEIDIFDLEIFVFKSLISFYLSLYFGLSIGSCQINCSLGTSLPR